MPTGKSCGCKGIRTCLLCEEQSDNSDILQKTLENELIFTYCPDCNLCWPNDATTASFCDYPLYLGKIKLVHEFCSKEDESKIISYIDKIPWMLSQSGRRKQDFGPKVNFKKKKVKIGDFKGFPKFAESLINEFQDLPELSNFDPVELCNLEYTVERGSAIDPHVDDFWLWGERLVTLNLNSTTVLTLTPCSGIACRCFQEANCSYSQLNMESTDNIKSCNHLSFRKDFVNCLSEKEAVNFKTNSFSCEQLQGNLQNLELSSKITENKEIPSSSEKIEGTQNLETYSNIGNTRNPIDCFEALDSSENKTECLKKSSPDYISTTSKTVSSKTTINYSINSRNIDAKINSICKLLTCLSNSKVCVRVVLPPRSLFILSGCARYNWFHEIKRPDVISRRLAMTFRELSSEFLDEGKESQLGKDLLLTAKNFYDL